MDDQAGWRQASCEDLPAIDRIARDVHPDFPEDPSVFAERLALYPSGLLILSEGPAAGYAISHPWLLGQPPPLDSLLGRLPDRPDTYYVHDIALPRESRGKGAGQRVMEILLDHAAAEGFQTVSLVSVIGEAYWGRFGFHDAGSLLPAGKLESYGIGARYMVRQVGRCG